jgi:membrane protease YdiL (CAAX protease family)
MRLAECFFLFYVTPVALAFVRWRTDWPLSFVMAFFFVAAFALLWRDPAFDRRNLFRFDAIRTGWKPVVLRFLILAAVLATLFFVLKPASAFDFPRRLPLTWFLFCLQFPFLPAYAEELVFRGFFLHRYRLLFVNDSVRWFACGIAFSLAHLHLANVWASALSFIGGMIFARTYDRSRSLPLVALEHALWGIFLFTIGLGPFFHKRLLELAP